MSPKEREILRWYEAEPPSVVRSLAQIFFNGALSRSGKLLFLGVPDADYMFKNPDFLLPDHLVEISMDLKVSAHTASLGHLRRVSRNYISTTPLIGFEKLIEKNINSDIEEAVELGLNGIIYDVKPSQIENLSPICRLSRKQGKFIGARLNLKDFESKSDFIQNFQNLNSLGIQILIIKLSRSINSGQMKQILECAFHGKKVVMIENSDELSRADLIEENQKAAHEGFFGCFLRNYLCDKPKSEIVELINKLNSVYRGDFES